MSYKDDAHDALEKFFDAVSNERDYQLGKAHEGSGWPEDFDAKNTINDWGAYLTHYLGERVLKMGLTPEQQKEGLVKVATLAAAAHMWLDAGRAPKRHYD